MKIKPIKFRVNEKEIVLTSVNNKYEELVRNSRSGKPENLSESENILFNYEFQNH